MPEIRSVLTLEQVHEISKLVSSVHLDERISRYIIDLVNATRNHPKVYLGASPRGSLALFRCAQTRAAMAGRDYVIPDDVKALAEVTLAHRIIAHDRDENTRIIVQEVLQYTPVPGASAR